MRISKFGVKSFINNVPCEIRNLQKVPLILKVDLILILYQNSPKKWNGLKVSFSVGDGSNELQGKSPWADFIPVQPYFALRAHSNASAELSALNLGSEKYNKYYYLPVVGTD